MRWIDFRYRAEFFVFRVVAALFQALPLELASGLSGWLWRVIAPRLRRHQRAMAQLGLAFPDMNEAERDRIAHEMWETLGRTFAESFHLAEIAASDRITVDPRATEALARTGGHFVICGAHQGNWEIATMGLLRMGLAPTGLYQRIKNPLVDAYVQAMRAPYYPSGLLAKEPATGLKLMRHVKRGGCLALLADLRDGIGVKVPFFGRPAPSTPFPAMLARNLDTPLFAVRIQREPGVRFALSVEEIPVPHTADRDADVLAATASLQAALERSIRARPEQWMWAHRRWG